MLIFDQLKKDDPQLRVITVLVLAGLSVLLAGLWWVQIVSARDYQAHLEMQSFRTVRIPAVRGKILDRNGLTLAENRPTYNISLYLDELRPQFDAAYQQKATRARSELAQKQEAFQQQVRRKLTKDERRQFFFSAKERNALREQARYEVASNAVWQVSARLGQTLSLNSTNFQKHYRTRLALPFAVVTDLKPEQIARCEEQSTNAVGVDIEVQSSRYYPYGTSAGHLIGHLRRNDDSKEGEESYFSYYLPDYSGVVGVEYSCDKELRGMAGAKSVLVNNAGYRQTENIWSPAEPGKNIVLTLDLPIQQAAERALQEVYGPMTQGAVVVMDVESGDVLAMASTPTLDPNWYVRGISRDLWNRITELQAEKNNATSENFMPGSIFKTVVGMAALEAGWNPDETIHVDPHPAQPNKGGKKVGNKTFHDTAPPGEYNFKRALKLSSNSYFITCGLQTGPESIIRLGERLHFGENMSLNTRQDKPGQFPDQQRLKSDWNNITTGNMCIGQDPVWVTPLQIAVLTSAIANRGKVLWPRLVDRIEVADPTSGVPPVVPLRGRLRDQLGVSQRTMQRMHDAMLGDTEDSDGTGRNAAVPGLRICAKTGTAQVQDVNNKKTGLTTWIASFAPYAKPRYAVVVMVEAPARDGESGGGTCGPVARKIYTAILEQERERTAKAQHVARSN